MTPLEMKELNRLRNRVAELENLLGVEWKCPPQWRRQGGNLRQWHILGLLIKRTLVTRSTILISVQADQRLRDRYVDERMADVYICGLRKILRTHGIEINTVPTEGWFLDAQNKPKAKALMTSMRAAANFLSQAAE